jgi:hypothetical protein
MDVVRRKRREAEAARTVVNAALVALSAPNGSKTTKS